MWPLGWSFSTLGCCQLLRQSRGSSFLSPFPPGRQSRGLGRSCCSVSSAGHWWAWDPPLHHTHCQPEPAARACAALCRTCPLSCPLPSPDAPTWALGNHSPNDPEQWGTSEVLPSLSPFRGPSISCLRCPFFNVPSKQSLLVLPKKAFPSCSLPGNPTKCPA